MPSAAWARWAAPRPVRTAGEDAVRRSGHPLLLAACLAPAVLGGCYAYTAYVHDRPVPGLVVEVTLNDHGRVTLAENIGPEVWRVEGSVASVGDSSFTLLVGRITGLDRTTSKWGGEEVTIPMSAVRELRERHFSTGRTVLLAGSVTAGLVGLIASSSIVGSSSGDGGGNPGPPVID